MPVFDEMHGADATVRPAFRRIADWLARLPPAEFARKRAEADTLFRRPGITFLVYGDEGGVERLIPVDVIPRVFAAAEWSVLERGCVQRVRALNRFIADIYHGREIIRAGVMPADLILANEFYRPHMQGLDLPGGIYTHIAGIDIVRTGENEFDVLEDNLRSPSGVSCMMENREVMLRLFRELLSEFKVAPVNHDPEELLRRYRAVGRAGARRRFAHQRGRRLRPHPPQADRLPGRRRPLPGADVGGQPRHLAGGGQHGERAAARGHGGDQPVQGADHFIEATPETPFLQIGETKYGKPILDRVANFEMPQERAAQAALVSSDSTMRSNISAGPPIDLVTCRRDSFRVARQIEITEGDRYFDGLPDPPLA
jgi:hypothetical protein